MSSSLKNLRRLCVQAHPQPIPAPAPAGRTNGFRRRSDFQMNVTRSLEMPYFDLKKKQLNRAGMVTF